MALASESFWFAVISALITVNLGVHGIFIKMLLGWRAALKEEVSKICIENEKDHEAIWTRVNHHTHNGGGRVIIND